MEADPQGARGKEPKELGLEVGTLISGVGVFDLDDFLEP